MEDVHVKIIYFLFDKNSIAMYYTKKVIRNRK